MASFEKKIIDFNTFEKAELNNEIARWSLCLGEVVKISSYDITLIREFIEEQFPNFTLGDIKEAAKLSMTGLFGDPSLYGQRLNVGYVISKLTKYRDYKKDALKEIHKRLEAYVEPVAYDPDFAMKSMVDSIKTLYAENLNGGEVFDAFNIVYEYIKKLKLFKVTKKETEDAKAYAEKATKNYYEKALKSEEAVALALADKAQKEIVELRYCKNYLLSLYFKKHALKDILSNVKIEHFIKQAEK